MRVLFFSNLFFFFFLALITALYAQPFNKHAKNNKGSTATISNIDGNGQRFSLDINKRSLSRNSRRKRDFQHAFNKK
jgi:hypothetical protein